MKRIALLISGLVLALRFSGCGVAEPVARHELWKHQMSALTQVPGDYAIPDANPIVLDPWQFEVAEDEDGLIWVRFKNIPFLNGNQ